MTLNILLQAAPSSSGLSMLLPLLAIFVVFYFFMIRPQQKKQKELTTYRNALKKGDKIVTTGGIYGKIHDVQEQTIIIEVDNNVHLKVDKSAVLMDPTDSSVQK